MPIIPVPKVVPDTDVLADQFNQMVDAIQDVNAGHDHNAALAYHGKAIDHSWLLAHGTHLHTVIDDHIDATGGTATHPVHGVPQGYSVMGQYGTQYRYQLWDAHFAQADVRTCEWWAHCETHGDQCSGGTSRNGVSAWIHTFTGVQFATIVGVQATLHRIPTASGGGFGIFKSQPIVLGPGAAYPFSTGFGSRSRYSGGWHTIEGYTDNYSVTVAAGTIAVIIECGAADASPQDDPGQRPVVSLLIWGT